MIDAKKIADDALAGCRSDLEGAVIELSEEVIRLQKLAKRGHGKEFVEGNGRFDVV